MTCEKKGENLNPIGLLQPQPVARHVCTDISMDFVELPNSTEKLDIFVGDILSEIAQSIPISHLYMAATIA